MKVGCRPTCLLHHASIVLPHIELSCVWPCRSCTYSLKDHNNRRRKLTASRANKKKASLAGLARAASTPAPISTQYEFRPQVPTAVGCSRYDAAFSQPESHNPMLSGMLGMMMEAASTPAAAMQYHPPMTPTTLAEQQHQQMLMSANPDSWFGAAAAASTPHVQGFSAPQLNATGSRSTESDASDCKPLLVSTSTVIDTLTACSASPNPAAGPMKQQPCSGDSTCRALQPRPSHSCARSRSSTPKACDTQGNCRPAQFSPISTPARGNDQRACATPHVPVLVMPGARQMAGGSRVNVFQGGNSMQGNQGPTLTSDASEGFVVSGYPYRHPADEMARSAAGGIGHFDVPAYHVDINRMFRHIADQMQVSA